MWIEQKLCRSYKITKIRKIFCGYIKNSALLYRGEKFDILHHFILKYDNCCNAKWSMGNAQWGLFVLVKFVPGSLERNLTTNLTFNQKQKKLKYEAFLKMCPFFRHFLHLLVILDYIMHTPNTGFGYSFVSKKIMI